MVWMDGIDDMGGLGTRSGLVWSSSVQRVDA